VLDEDIAGQKGTNLAEKLCKDYFDFQIMTLSAGKDPGDYDVTQLRLTFKEYLR
jgi:hypothetical protein